MEPVYNIQKLLKLPGTEKYVLVKGLILSTIFYFIIRFIPLKYYIHLLQSGASNYSNKEKLGDYQKLITKSISRLEKIIPWQMTCLNKVITARYLYRSFDIDTTINLSLFVNSSGKRCAHASLIIGDTMVYLPLNENVKKIYLKLAT